ncbi:hypothetical protein BDV93DRAFT_514765 [Ceratobasidium sp. AG-I]|nr:hypothetical protein BDV93DRAFT_514765 [Ceratobasidium sp. AG-I]
MPTQERGLVNHKASWLTGHIRELSSILEAMYEAASQHIIPPIAGISIVNYTCRHVPEYMRATQGEDVVKGEEEKEFNSFCQRMLAKDQAVQEANLELNDNLKKGKKAVDLKLAINPKPSAARSTKASKTIQKANNVQFKDFAIYLSAPKWTEAFHLEDIMAAIEALHATASSGAKHGAHQVAEQTSNTSSSGGLWVLVYIITCYNHGVTYDMDPLPACLHLLGLVAKLKCSPHPLLCLLYATMSAKEETKLTLEQIYVLAKEATNKLLSIVERFEQDKGPVPEHVQHGIPALLNPILELVSQASKLNLIDFLSSSFSFFSNWITTPHATKLTALLWNLFETARHEFSFPYCLPMLTIITIKGHLTPTRLPSSCNNEAADIYPPATHSFLKEFGKSHAGLGVLMELVLKYEAQSPPWGNFGIFGRIAANEVLAHALIPQLDCSASGSSKTLFLGKSTIFIMEVTMVFDGLPASSIPAMGPWEFKSIQTYVDMAILVLNGQLTMSFNKLQSEHETIAMSYNMSPILPAVNKLSMPDSNEDELNLPVCISQQPSQTLTIPLVPNTLTFFTMFNKGPVNSVPSSAVAPPKPAFRVVEPMGSFLPGKIHIFLTTRWQTLAIPFPRSTWQRQCLVKIKVEKVELAKPARAQHGLKRKLKSQDAASTLEGLAETLHKENEAVASVLSASRDCVRQPLRAGQGRGATAAPALHASSKAPKEPLAVRLLSRVSIVEHEECGGIVMVPPQWLCTGVRMLCAYLTTALAFLDTIELAVALDEGASLPHTRPAPVVGKKPCLWIWVVCSTHKAGQHIKLRSLFQHSCVSPIPTPHDPAANKTEQFLASANQGYYSFSTSPFLAHPGKALGQSLLHALLRALYQADLLAPGLAQLAAAVRAYEGLSPLQLPQDQKVKIGGVCWHLQDWWGSGADELSFTTAAVPQAMLACLHAKHFFWSPGCILKVAEASMFTHQPTGVHYSGPDGI